MKKYIFTVIFCILTYAHCAAKGVNGNNFQYVDMGNFNIFSTVNPKYEKNSLLKKNNGSLIINENINTSTSRTNVYQKFNGGYHNKVYGPSLVFGRVIKN